MKTLTTFILAGALALLAQPNQLDLRQDPPVAVQSERVSSAYTGTSGATTYYYWVVTRYPIGFIVPTSPVVVGGASALGGGNSVALGWPAMTGASSYDVLRTETNAAPSSCTCAVVLATTGTTLTDNGGALSAWPPGGLNSAGVAQAEFQINNRDAGAPYITMAVRNAQRILNYQLGILKNGTAPSYVPSGFIQPYANEYGVLSCVDSSGNDCLGNRQVVPPGATLAQMQAILTACTSGVVTFTPGAYSIADSLNVPNPCKISLRGATVTQTTANKVIFNVSSSGVTIEGGALVGPQATYRDAERAIQFVGASAASQLADIAVRDVNISLFGGYGIHALYVTRFNFTGNTIRDIGYAGIMGVSATNGRIENNYIDGLVGDATPLAYGISLTRNQSDSLVTEPRSSDVVVSGNNVRNSPWENYDTHAGVRITFENNISYGGLNGIVCVTSTNASAAAAFAPDCLISGNIIESGVTDGSKQAGIKFTGVNDGSELGHGIITNNTVVGYGTQNNNIGSGGILAYATEGLIISANVIKEPSPVGINLLHYNYGAVVDSNTITDVWTEVSPAIGIWLRNYYNYASATGNRFTRGAKTATAVWTQGFRVGGDATNQLTMGVNSSFTVPTTYLLISTNGIAKPFQIPETLAFASLPAVVSQAPNGTTVYCSDCDNVVDNAATPGANCSDGGAGTIARVENGAWRCN